MNRNFKHRFLKQLRIVHLVFIFLFAYSYSALAGPGGMILNYTTTDPNTSIELPLYGTVNVTVDWGDSSGGESISIPGNHSHLYSIPGSYSVNIIGSVDHFGNVPTSGIDKLVSVTTWDGVGITSFENGFVDASNLTSVPTTLPSEVTNLANMFNGASSFDQDISTWDVGAVTNMTGMLTGVTLSVANYDAIFSAWSSLYPLESNVTLDAPNCFYSSTAEPDRFGLINTYGWTINDAGINTPIVTTYEVTDSTTTTATGNGDITHLGISNPSQYGVCWSTETNPTIDDVNDFKTTQGEATATGAFTSDMTGLIPGTMYYVRAYATNTAGTVYGSEVYFTTVGMMELTFDIATLSDIIALPLYGNVDVIVDWNDETENDTITTDGNHEHSYTTIGAKNVVITGKFEHFGSILTSGINRLTHVTSWNSYDITSFENAFYGANQLVAVPASLPPGVTNTSNMFRDAANFNYNIGSWDVSAVTNMSNMFRSAIKFNQNISSWDVSAVTNMSGMFNQANIFNQNIGSWDVSMVTNMYSMFTRAGNFNQNIGSWDVSKVLNMGYMFEYAGAFNQSIGSWTVSAVTNMYAMFAHATSFNQDLGNWDVSKVSDMTAMFTDATLSIPNYNSLLNAWSLRTLKSGVTFDAPNCFYSTEALTSHNNIVSQGWTINDAGLNTPVVTTQEVTDTSTNTAIGNGNITHLGISNPSQYGICWSTETNPSIDDVNDFKTSQGTAAATGAFTSDLTGLSMGTLYYVRAYATNTAGTGYGNEVSFISLGKMELQYNTTLSVGTTILLPLYGNVDVSVNWGDGNIESITSDGLHSHTYATDEIYNVVIIGRFEHFGSSSATGIDKLVSVDSWEGIGITSFENGFRNASNLISVPASLPVGLTNMQNMLRNAISINQDIDSWDVSEVTNMYGLFYGANSFNKDISSWDVSSVTNMSFMFFQASTFNQDLGNWDVSKVTNMSDMFFGVTLSVDNYNSLLNSWSLLTLQEAVTLDAPNCFYSSAAETSRGDIISQGWTINDAGINTPIITTQAVSDISIETATGNGNVTHLGISNPTQHGVCWSAETTPTIDDINDFKSTEGEATSTGAFTSAMTGLTASTTYYVRAYATNTAGTVYGDEVSFTTDGLLVPVDLTVSNVTIPDQGSNCYDAQNEITVAGSGNTVIVENGGSATFIAGSSILFLPGFHAQSGSYVDAHITTTASFCSIAPPAIVAAETQLPIQEKSLPIALPSAANNEKSIKVYPNPNKGQFTIDFINFQSEGKVMVFNATGKIIYNICTTANYASVNLSNVQRGLYFVKVISNKDNFTQKIIIQ